MTLTTTMANWKRLKTQLSTEYPSWVLGTAINRMIAFAEKGLDSGDQEIEL